MKSLVVLFTVVFVLVSCSTTSKEEKLALSYETTAGNDVKFKSFEFLMTFTYEDSVKIWQDSLDINRKAYLAKMDSAETHLDKAYEAAVKGKTTNTFSALEGEFNKVITDVEQSRLRIEINRANANENGDNTPLKKYFEKIEEMQSKKDEVIYNVFKGELTQGNEPSTKFYYFDESNEKVITTVEK